MSLEPRAVLNSHEKEFANLANSVLEHAKSTSFWDFYDKFFTKRPQLKDMFNGCIGVIKETYSVISSECKSEEEILSSFKRFYEKLIEIYGLLIYLDDVTIGSNSAETIAGKLKTIFIEYHQKQTRSIKNLFSVSDRLLALKEKLLLIPQETLSKKLSTLHELCGADVPHLTPLCTVFDSLRVNADFLEGEKAALQVRIDELEKRISEIEKQAGDGSVQAKTVIDGLRKDIDTLRLEKEKLSGNENALKIREMELNGRIGELNTTIKMKEQELASKAEELRKAQDQIERHKGLSDAQLEAFAESSLLRKRFERMNTIFVPPEFHSHLSFATASNIEFDMMLGVVTRITSERFNLGDVLQIRPYLQLLLPSTPPRLLQPRTPRGDQGTLPFLDDDRRGNFSSFPLAPTLYPAPPSSRDHASPPSPAEGLPPNSNNEAKDSEPDQKRHRNSKRGGQKK